MGIPHRIPRAHGNSKGVARGSIDARIIVKEYYKIWKEETCVLKEEKVPKQDLTSSKDLTMI